MKKRLMLLLMLCALLAVFPAQAELDQSQALETIYGYLDNFYGFAPEDLTLSNFGGEDGIWTASFTLKDHDDASNGLYVVEIDAEGHLRRIDGPQQLNLIQQAGTELNRVRISPRDSANRESYEELAAFTEKWTSLLPALELGATENGWDISEVKDILALHARLPEDGMLPWADALDAAKQVLTALPGFSEEAANTMYFPYIAGFIQPDGAEKPMWSVLFSWDSEQSAQVKKLLGDYPPVQISLLLDGETGEMVGAPLVDVVPVQFSFFSFFCRVPEAVAACAIE